MVSEGGNANGVGDILQNRAVCGWELDGKPLDGERRLLSKKAMLTQNAAKQIRKAEDGSGAPGRRSGGKDFLFQKSDQADSNVSGTKQGGQVNQNATVMSQL